MKPLILVCSSNAEYFMLMRHILEVDGYIARLAGTEFEVLEVAQEILPAAVIIDCQPFAPTIIDTCRLLKCNEVTKAVPLVAIIGAGAETLYLDLIKVGVDEILIRPAAPVKILDFLRLQISLQSTDERLPSRVINCGNIEMNLECHRVIRDGAELVLGPIEYRLLQHLMLSPGKVFSRDELIGAAWSGDKDIDPRTVDVHIGRLRRLIRGSAGEDPIRTVRSAGYAIDRRLKA